MSYESASLAARGSIESLRDPWQAIGLGFLAEKAQRSGSRCTVEVYGRTVARFLAGLDDIGAVQPLDVHRFAYGLGPTGTPPTPSTVSVRLAAIAGFFDFAVRMGVVDANPADKVRRPGPSRPMARGLSLAEVHRLLVVIPDTPAGATDKAIIITAILTGLRRSELIGMRVLHPTLGEQPRYITRAKGGVLRVRELPLPAYEAICALGTTRAFPPPDEDGSEAFSISAATFYVHLRHYAEQAGLGSISPHTLRHTAAKLRRQGGASIENVSLLLGHQSIATTAIYLRQLEPDLDDGWAPISAALGLSSEATGSTRPDRVPDPQARHGQQDRTAARTTVLPDG